MKWLEAEAYAEPSRTSKTELFVNRANGNELLTIFAKSSILDFALRSGYACGKYYSDNCCKL